MVSVVYSSTSPPEPGTHFRPDAAFLRSLEVEGIMFELRGDKSFPIFISAKNEIIWSAVLFIYQVGIRSRSYSNETIRTYTEHMVCWLKFLECTPSNIIESKDETLQVRIEQATEETLLNFRNSMRENVSKRTGLRYASNTINSRVDGVKRYYSWAHSKGHFHSMLGDFFSELGPYTNHPYPNSLGVPTRTRVRIFEKIPKIVKIHEFRQLLNLASVPEQLAYRWMLSTGLRREEICALNIGQIPEVSNLEPSLTPLVDIYVRRKGGKEMALKVPFLLVEETNWYISIHRLPTSRLQKISQREIEKQPLFVNSRKRRFSGDHFGARFRHYTSLINLNFTPHDLRHTFAVCVLKILIEMERNGALINPLKILQLLLGHNQIGTVEIYLRAMEFSSTEVASALDYLYGASLKDVDFSGGNDND